MEIIIDNKGTANQQVQVRDIEGDMGEDTRLQLIQQADGDVVLCLYDPTKGSIDSIEFCTSSGGGRHPWIAKKLREMIANFQIEKQYSRE